MIPLRYVLSRNICPAIFPLHYTSFLNNASIYRTACRFSGSSSVRFHYGRKCLIEFFSLIHQLIQLLCLCNEINRPLVVGMKQCEQECQAVLLKRASCGQNVVCNSQICFEKKNELPIHLTSKWQFLKFVRNL